MAQGAFDHFATRGHNNSMKNLMFFLLLALAYSCSSMDRPDRLTKSPDETVKESVSKNRGVWVLHSNEKLTLHFKNLDNGRNASIILEHGISEQEIGPGHWELRSFAKAGVTFLAVNTSKKFVLNKRFRQVMYAGSIVVACPKVGTQQFKYLKGMKFFNRYHFKSTIGACEIVIGNELEQAENELRKTHKSRHLKLVIGF